MKKNIVTSVCNLICAVLLCALLITQFMPFWTCSGCKNHKDTEQTVSVAGYIWLPKHHTTLTKDMTDVYLDVYGEDYRDADGKKFKFTVNEILPYTITVFLGCVIGMVVCVLLRKKFVAGFIPLIAGIAGILGCTTYPAMQIGISLQAYFLTSIVVTVAAAFTLLIGLFDVVIKKLRKCSAV